MQNSTFEFLLFEGEKLIQEIKSQSSNLAISGLEPGILYTVVIKTELCGKKSKPVQQKVKTGNLILEIHFMRPEVHKGKDSCRIL